jgi:uncharacterized protein
VIGVVETVVRNLVDHPDQVEIEEERDGGEVVFYVRVHADDRGNVIGRSGSTVEALRTLLGGIAQRQRLRVDVEILD